VVSAARTDPLQRCWAPASSAKPGLNPPRSVGNMVVLGDFGGEVAHGAAWGGGEAQQSQV